MVFSVLSSKILSGLLTWRSNTTIILQFYCLFSSSYCQNYFPIERKIYHQVHLRYQLLATFIFSKTQSIKHLPHYQQSMVQFFISGLDASPFLSYLHLLELKNASPRTILYLPAGLRSWLETCSASTILVSCGHHMARFGGFCAVLLLLNYFPQLTCKVLPSSEKKRFEFLSARCSESPRAEAQ